MGLNNDALLLPAHGRVYVAPVGTPPPTDFAAIPAASPWIDHGHTSLDNGLSFAQDGGDTTTISTWAADGVIQKVDPVVDSITYNPQQLDDLTLTLYYGGPSSTATPGEYAAPDTVAVQERAMFVQFVHTTGRVVAYWAARVGIKRGDSVSVDPTALLEFPLSATILAPPAGSKKFKWLSYALNPGTNEVQTVTITGSPTGGTFTLTFDGDTTTSIAYNATAAAVEAALDALDSTQPDVDSGKPGGVTVTGSAGGPYTVTFDGYGNVAQMTATSSLTGGTSPGVTVSTTTAGTP